MHPAWPSTCCLSCFGVIDGPKRANGKEDESQGRTRNRRGAAAEVIDSRNIADFKRMKKTDQGLDCKQTGLYSCGMGRTRETSEARKRILETADRLFYQDGIRAVGIDRIIAEAGVAKMSLYKHFPSKDDLILAVLQYREQSVLEFFRSAMERHGKKAKNRLRAFLPP